MKAARMELDIADTAGAFRAARLRRNSRHDPADRAKPSLFQYDYLALTRLSADIESLIAALPGPRSADPPLALDLGCGRSPYRELLAARGFLPTTLDIDPTERPDFVGAVEQTGLPDRFADLILCTQVIEHSLDPGGAVCEMFRILRPGGHLIATVPHVWFYHPHPSDNWRFTQEGLVRLVARAGFQPVRLLAQGGPVLCLLQIVNFLAFGALGRWGAPLYAALNLIGCGADRLIRNDLFSINFAILARKPDEDSAPA